MGTGFEEENLFLSLSTGHNWEIFGRFPGQKYLCVTEELRVKTASQPIRQPLDGLSLAYSSRVEVELNGGYFGSQSDLFLSLSANHHLSKLAGTVPTKRTCPKSIR